MPRGWRRPSSVQASSVRRRLLFRGRRHGDVPDRRQERARLESRSSTSGELEVAVARPVRQAPNRSARWAPASRSCSRQEGMSQTRFAAA